MSPPGTETIEHFRPKSRFPQEAFSWENLYFCCNHCQHKGDDYDDAMIRPDETGYEFERFFRWDFTTGEIMVNEAASAKDQTRARLTIQIYRFNQGHPQLRRRAAEIFLKCQEDLLDLHPYRHFIAPHRQAPNNQGRQSE